MKRYVIIAAVCVCTAVPAWAMPSYFQTGQAEWARGSPGTTWQAWDFLSGLGPDDIDPGESFIADPEDFYNPYGNPTVTITGQDSSVSGLPDFGWIANHLGSDGVWAGDPVWIDIEIDNTDVTSGYKEVWMEIGFAAVAIDPFDGPILTAYDSADQSVGFDVERIYYSLSGIGTGWNTMTAGWRIAPNPQLETLSVGFAGTGGFVDYIIVDTACIPAPGALLLGSIGIGLVGFLRRKRHI